MENINNLISSLGDTANQIGSFMNHIKNNLTPEQQAAIEKELGGLDKVNEKLAQAQKEVQKAQAAFTNIKQ